MSAQGADIMKVSDIMSSPVSVVPEDTAETVSRLMFRKNVGAVPVCTPDGHLCGVVTDRDVTMRVTAAGGDPRAVTAGEIMTRDPVTLSPDDGVKKAAELMAKCQVRRLPVVQDGRLRGMLSLGDVAKSGLYAEETAAALCEISRNVHRSSPP